MQAHPLRSQSSYPMLGRTSRQQFLCPISHFSNSNIMKQFFQKIVIQEFFFLYSLALAINTYAYQHVFI
jgi:hypothetical protein